MLNKFAEVSAEMSHYKTAIICITETWLKPSSLTSFYSVEGYRSFFNNRVATSGGGTMILVTDECFSKQVACDVTNNDAYNICAVVIGKGRTQTVVVCVYRAPWATLGDMEDMCQLIDSVGNYYFKK